MPESRNLASLHQLGAVVATWGWPPRSTPSPPRSRSARGTLDPAVLCRRLLRSLWQRELGSPVVPFYPFSFWVPLLEPNSRKKGTLIIKGLLGNLEKQGSLERLSRSTCRLLMPLTVKDCDRDPKITPKIKGLGFRV